MNAQGRVTGIQSLGFAVDDSLGAEDQRGHGVGSSMNLRLMCRGIRDSYPSFATTAPPTVTALPRQAVLRRHNATVASSGNAAPEPHQPADSSAPVMNPPASAPRRPGPAVPGDELEAICVPAIMKELTVPRRLAHSAELMSFSRRTDELVTLKRQRARPSLHVLQSGLLVFQSGLLRVGIHRALHIVEQEVRDLELHIVDLRDVMQDQRVVGGGLQGEGPASEEPVDEVALTGDIGDARQWKIMATTVEDAMAGDDTLRSERVSGGRPTKNRHEEQGERRDENDRPHESETERLPFGRHVDGGEDATSQEKDLGDDIAEDRFNVGSHMTDDDFVLGQELSHAPILSSSSAHWHYRGRGERYE